jgi:hypothetical protein
MIEWQKAWLIFQSYPLFGVGIGGFAWQSVWLEYHGGLAHSSEFALFTHPHNLVAILLAEVGLNAADAPQMQTWTPGDEFELARKQAIEQASKPAEPR